MDNEMTCRSCENCSNLSQRLGEENSMFKGCFMCNLDRVIHSRTGKDALNCDYFNKDMTNEPICYNCEHYLGGGDWGLSCANDYYKLVEATSKICDNFKKKA